MANTIPQGAEKGEKRERLSISGESPLRSVRRALTGAALGVLAMQVPTGASAEDIRIAGNSTSGKVAGVFDGIPTTEEAMEKAQERQRYIAQVSRIRQAGIKYYAPYLEKFYALDEEGQYQVALAIYPNNAIGGPDLSREFIELVRNLRVPEEMIDAILEEARKGGADDFFEIPGFEDGLYQLRNEGNIGAETVGYIIEKAPNTTSQLYIVVLSLVTQERLENAQKRLENAQKRLENAQKRLVDAQGRLVDAQGRLVDAQGRLVDAQGRLVDLQEIQEQLREIEGQQNKILGNN